MIAAAQVVSLERGSELPSGDLAATSLFQTAAANVIPLPLVDRSRERSRFEFQAPLIENTPISSAFARNVLMLGTGQYADAIGRQLCRNGYDVKAWGRRDAAANAINERFAAFLQDNPDAQGRFTAGTDLSKLAIDRGVIVVALPSHALPQVLPRLKPHPDTVVISLTKGFVFPDWNPYAQTDSLMKGPDENAEVYTPLLYMRSLPHWGDLKHLAVASGPGFAKNIERNSHFALTLASPSERALDCAKYMLGAGRVKIQLVRDSLSVEIAGAMKNVIAIATGIVEGHFESRRNAQDPFDTMGIEERSIVKSMGLCEALALSKFLEPNRKKSTFFYYAGMADLDLTCTPGSRNYRVGLELGRSKELSEIVKSSAEIAEGLVAAWGAKRLTDPHGMHKGVYMPVTNAVIDIMQGHYTPGRVVDQLMKDQTAHPESSGLIGLAEPFSLREFPVARNSVHPQ